MPTYVYRCAKCGEQIEAFQSFADTPLTKHDDCGGKLAKVLSAAGHRPQGLGLLQDRQPVQLQGRLQGAFEGVVGFRVGLRLVRRLEIRRLEIRHSKSSDPPATRIGSGSGSSDSGSSSGSGSGAKSGSEAKSA